MPRRRFAGVLAVAVAAAAAAAAATLALAAPARADFAPALGVALGPPTAASPSALAATIVQPPLDTAVERFTLNLPPGFTALEAPDAAICPLPSIRLGNCSPASQIGTAAGLSGTELGFSGTIHKASADKFGVILTALGGSVRQVVAGSLSKRDDGSLDLTLDELPALAVSRLTVRFYGGGRSLVQTPGDCGSYPIDGKFTSRRDELAIAQAAVTISGCEGVPAIAVANLRMSRQRIRAGHRTIIAWSASRAADHTNVRIERRQKRRWRVAGVLVATANAGENVLHWNGRIRGRKLRPGRYRVRIQPAGSAPAGPALGLRILKPRRSGRGRS